MLEHYQIIQGAVALVAFIMAFYALVARERRTPYSVGTAYQAVYFSAGVTILALIGKAFAAANIVALGDGITLAAELLLAVALVTFVYRVGRMHNRDRNLRDDGYWKNIAFVRPLLNAFSSRRPRDIDYDHAPTGVHADLITALGPILGAPEEALERALATSKEFGSLSVVVMCNRSRGLDIILEASKAFLVGGMPVQITTAVRHPAEVLLPLKRGWSGGEATWKPASRRLVLVDAHTPHFGFVDSTHKIWTRRVAPDCLEIVTSEPTFAGIHTAAARAYNLFKTIGGGGAGRTPTLVIYDGLHALADLESPEQYRVFCRHVLASERLWGGMFTVFLESDLDAAGKNALMDHADLFIEAPTVPAGAA